jgi:hypothetical protein
MVRRAHAIFLAVVVSSIGTVPGWSQEPGWTPRVVKMGEDREVSENTDILERPYRPLHFYGNTVRRRYYRGRAMPNSQDVRTTLQLLMQR